MLRSCTATHTESAHGPGKLRSCPIRAPAAKRLSIGWCTPDYGMPSHCCCLSHNLGCCLPGAQLVQPRQGAGLPQNQAVRPPTAHLYAASRPVARLHNGIPGLDPQLSNLVYPSAAVQRPAFPNGFVSQQMMHPGQAPTARACAPLPSKAVHAPLATPGGLAAIQRQQPVIHGISS